MRLNKEIIMNDLQIMNFRLGLGEFTDKFAAYALLEKLIKSNFTMNPMSENELYILFKESYGFSPKNILDIYMDFVSTLSTDIEVSISKREDELWFETEDELISVEI